MKDGSDNSQRRNFLKLGSVAVASSLLLSRLATPASAAAPHVDEKDPTAQALGYKNDATKVDKAKYKQYAAGTMCANCNQFQGKAADAWGPCTIFAGKDVNSKGWCSAYTKKA